MNPWLPLLYQYAVGGLLLFGGIGIALVSGGAQWRAPEDRRTIIILILGYLGYLALHSFWTWRALQ